MVKYKSLLDPEIRKETERRILALNKEGSPKWGQLDVSQMLYHCNKVLMVAIGKIILPKTNPVIYAIGNLTKIEMRIFNNGIPHNMPTFSKLIVKENCNFGESRDQLLKTLGEFCEIAESGKLPKKHELFGTMTTKDWGFMEHKHLDNHLKQFGV